MDCKNNSPNCLTYCDGNGDGRCTSNCFVMGSNNPQCLTYCVADSNPKCTSNCVDYNNPQCVSDCSQHDPKCKSDCHFVPPPIEMAASTGNGPPGATQAIYLDSWVQAGEQPRTALLTLAVMSVGAVITGTNR